MCISSERLALKKVSRRGRYFKRAVIETLVSAGSFLQSFGPVKRLACLIIKESFVRERLISQIIDEISMWK